MKKIYLVLFVIMFLFLGIGQTQAKECTGATGIVKCGINASCPCELTDFFTLLARIYEFMVWKIASPLAILMVTIGGVLMLISAGNPNLFGLGKKTVYASIIGIILVFGALLIINSILGLMGIPPI